MAKNRKMPEGSVPSTVRTAEEQKGAISAWRLLSLEKRMAIVREIVETRCDELRRAYPQVVGVMAGLKRTSNKKRDAALRKKPEPAVIFVVDRKRGKKSLSPEDRIEPLYHYCNVNRRRRMCQVPTDVEEVKRYSAIRPGSNRRVSVDGSKGVVCCAVQIPVDGWPLAAVSCHHLFERLGQTVSLNGKRVGNVKHLGDLTPAPKFSCDVALATDVNRSNLWCALNKMTIDRGARSKNGIPRAPKKYYVQSPDGPLPATYRADFKGVFFYDNFGIDVRHAILIESRMEKHRAIAGYSGSSVTTKKNGGVLLGMHIAGDGGDIALMLPIWEILQTNSYKTLPESKKLRLKLSL